MSDAWVDVCDWAELTPDRGVCALVADEPVAVFRLSGGELYAIGNIDPCCGASVLSRGLVGSRDGTLVVASPMYKNVFDLATGRCVDTNAEVHTYPVRVRSGRVEVCARSDAS